MNHDPYDLFCPRCPEHCRAIQRWLPPSERKFFNSEIRPDVFEIDCPACGKHEYVEDYSLSYWPLTN
jgi:hypothetical protein